MTVHEFKACRFCARKLAKGHPCRPAPTTCGRPRCRGRAAAKTRGAAAMAAIGRLGGRARPTPPRVRTEEWKLGYRAGWMASGRSFRRLYPELMDFKKAKAS